MIKFWTGALLALALFLASPVWADGPDSPERPSAAPAASESPALPAVNGDILASPEENPLRLTPDRTRVLRLDQDAASVIVTNPRHAAVILETPRLLIIMPREPGTTAFTVLDRQGQTVLERNIIVTGAQQKYVRVRKSCSGSDDPSCAPSAYFYCPDGCYEVSPVPGDQQMGNVPEISGGSPVATPPAPDNNMNSQAPPPQEEPIGETMEQDFNEDPQ